MKYFRAGPVSFLRRIGTIVFFMLGLTPVLLADQIDIGIFESATPGKIEVRIRPDFTINADETVTGILYTLRWSDPTIVITTLDPISPYFIAFDGTAVLDNGYYYQRFLAIPMLPVGTAIPANSERVISSFSYTGNAGSYFELVDNYWTQANNGGPYIEFMGDDLTGIIYHATAPAPCALTLTCPGNISVPPDAGSCGAIVTYSAPVVSGDCEGVTVTQTAGLPSGSLFPAGTTTNSFLATSSEGPTANCSFAVTVNSLPGPAGTISGTSSVCQGSSGVAYSVTPITNATSYVWTYSGIGATIIGSGNAITINYSTSATSGNLKVYGVNTCGNGTASPNFPVNVTGLPGAAGPIVGTTSVCQGQSGVNYTVAPIANATSYHWSYSGTGATISGSGRTVTVSFSISATSGNLTVYGSNNCGTGAVSPSYAITVNPLPGPAGTITGTTPVCQGQSNVTYSVAAIPNATSYTWSFSGTGATIVGSGASVTISFSLSATSGNLTVFGVNSCGNGSVSSNYPITVNPLPGAAGTITGTTSVCQGQSNLAYSVDAIPNATSYTWSYSGTGTTIVGSGASVTINFSTTATSGNLTVYGINSCGNGAVSPNYAVTVNMLPGPAGTISGTTPVCQGQNNVAYSVAAIPNATSYTWSYSGTGATITNTGTTATISFSTTATSGNLTVYGSNNCGTGIISPNYAITVNPLPGAAGTITGTTPVCQGQSNVAYSVTAIPNATSYAWSYSGTGATINGSGLSVTINFNTTATSGNLTVNGVNSCGNGTPSPGYPILVLTTPAAPISGGNQAICSGQTIPSLNVTVEAGATADWYASVTGGTPIATGTLSYTPAAAGTYYAEARNLAAGCLSSSRTAVTLTIHSLPVVYAGADRSIPNGTSTTITDATASGTAVLSYSWTPAVSFVNPTVLNPTTVNLFSTHTYTLTVTDGHSCSNNDQMTITITGGVLGADPDAVPAALCAGQTTQLHANASGGSGTYTYSWTSSPAGFTSTQADPAASPSETTIYTVVVGDGFNSVSDNVQVIVHPLPASPISGGDHEICADEEIPSLTVTVGSGETADWYSAASGGALLAYGTLDFAPAGAGTYYAGARNLTTGCLSPARTGVTLTIHNLPDVFAGADQSIPYGTSTTISDAIATGAATLNYAWTPVGSFVNPAILHPTTINLTSTGTCTLTVTDGNSCVNSDQMTITVTGSPLSVNPEAMPDTLCPGESTQLSANASGGSGTYSYSWTSDPAGFTSLLANPQTSPVVTTTYTVEVNDGFNTMTNDVLVVVEPLPGPAGTITGSSIICLPQEGISFSVAAIADAIWYEWNYTGAGVIIHGNGPSVTIDFSALATSGMVKVAGVNECGIGTLSEDFAITTVLLVVECPVDMEVTTEDPAFPLTGGTPQGGIYSGTGVSNGIFDPAAAGIGEHSITYTYEDAYGCTDSCPFVITVTANEGSPGDANCDGAVNVLDIITITNYIMLLDPSPFCFDEADTNDDLIINVLDIIGTVNIILSP